MKKQKNSVEAEENTNPYPIYPDIDERVRLQGQKVTVDQIVQDTDLVNPDPETLDRG